MLTVLASLQRGASVAPQGRRSGVPDSLRAGLADPPEDWPAASPYVAAGVITREPIVICIKKKKKTLTRGDTDHFNNILLL